VKILSSFVLHLTMPSACAASSRRRHLPSSRPRAQTLGGALLGYVPRELTRRFPHATTFAHVYGIGVAADTGLYGAQVLAA